MNPPDDFFIPLPEPVDLTEEQELELQRHLHNSRARIARLQKERRRRLKMAAQDGSFSSDEEVDSVTSKIKNKLDITPNSTPQELVKLDPSEIGMSAGYKHLYVTSADMNFSRNSTNECFVRYSGKEDKRGRFQWQAEIPEDIGKPAEDAESEVWTC